MKDEEVFWYDDGKEYCDEDIAISRLLRDNCILCNSRKYVELDGSIGEETVLLFVICSDVFYWAYADAEAFTIGDVPKLYKMHVEDPVWGTAKWCCFKRNMRPQKPVEDRMKKDGSWDEKMEALKR